MVLPQNPTPVYSLTIPSTKKQIKYRPFLVKEEKALLIAQQSDDPVVQIDTLKQVIQSCIVAGDVNINTLASFDLEYLFTRMRAVSVGEVVQLIFPCDDCDSEKARVMINLDISKMEVVFPEGHANKIPLFEDVGVVMKYPTADVIRLIDQSDGSDIDVVFDIIISCIDYIYDSEEIFMAKDQQHQDLVQFLNNLTSAQFEKVQAFFQEMPKLQQEIDYKCPVCGKEHHKVLEGLASFF